MGDDAGRARDFEEPAFPRGPRGAVRAEPPLSVGTWTDFADTDDDESSDDGVPDLGPEQMVEAAVPRARGARRVLPGEADPEGEGGDGDDETTVRIRPARPARIRPQVPEVILGKAEDIVPLPEDDPEEDDPEEEDREEEREGEGEGAVADGGSPGGGEGLGYRDHPDASGAWEHTGNGYAAGGMGSSENLAYAMYQEPVPSASAYTYPSFIVEPADPLPVAAVHSEPGSGQLELRRGGRHGDGAHSDRLTFDLVNDNEVRPTRTPFEIAVLLGAPALALTALLYYFGWARSAAMADFLGFDADVLGYTSREYLLRSVDTLYRPILAVVGVLLAARMLHPHVLVRLRSHRRAAARLSWVLRCAWFAVPVAAWTAVFKWPGNWPLWWPLLLPCALTVGVLVSAYGVLLSRQLGTHRRATGMGVRPWSLSVVLTSAAVVLCLFWTLGAYAQADGQATALRMVKTLPSRTSVVVYSANDLRVAADQGVTAEALTGRDSPYRFRYSGLRLLRRAEGRLFLLPDRWSWDRPRLIVVREDAGVRVEYLRAR